MKTNIPKRAASILFFCAITANAAITGNELYAMPKVAVQTYLLGWLEGYQELHSKLLLSNKLLSPGAVDYVWQQLPCVPRTITLGQITDVVLRQLRDHPENRNAEAATLVDNAISKTWPCPDK